MALLAQVVVEKATIPFDHAFSYRIPAGMAAVPGCRVTVPFGAKNQRRVGLVLGLTEDPPGKGTIKEIVSLVDETPVLNEEQLMLLRYLKEITFCTYFDALKLLIPAGLGIRIDEGYSVDRERLETAEDLEDTERQIIAYLLTQKRPKAGRSICKTLGLQENHPALRALVQKGLLRESPLDTRKIQDEKIVMVELAEEELPEKLTARQREVCQTLLAVGSASLKELCYFCGVTRSVVDTLEKKGIVLYHLQQTYRTPYTQLEASPAVQNALSDAQKAVFEKALEICRSPKEQTALLYGVTGSGKTQVYLELVKQTVADGKQAIVLVPEISLTPQTVQMFKTSFGRKTAILHSSLSMSERLDEWKRIKNGDADIVVGTRSAIFAPLDRLGLIVIDEEQEQTYKSEMTPRFVTIDIARARIKYHKAMLLLSSATPSVEAFYQASEGRSHLLKLTERFAGAKLPEVEIVDMQDQPGAALFSGISKELAGALEENLNNKEQSILLLNRRGYHTLLKCSSCGQVISCPNCSVPLTFHAANQRLMCHYCGHSQPIPTECPNCHSKMVKYTGIGTQRLEENVKALFPQARVLRMDTDTTMSRFSYEEQFGRFARGEYDIMIGTQMVAKGLNFPRVTLVGVVNADQGLYSEDFRNCERTFDLLTQVIGRGGRSSLPGRAMIQTASPDSEVIYHASTQDYEAFYEQEILFRKLNLYPPFCDIVLFGTAAEQENKAQEAIRWVADRFAAIAKEDYPKLPIRVLGPSQANLYRVSGKYRYQLLIKCRNTRELRELCRKVQEQFFLQFRSGETTLIIDTHYDARY